LVFATVFDDFATPFAGAAGLDVGLFAAETASFLVVVPEVLCVAVALAGALDALLAPFTPVATAFFGAAFFVAMMITPFLEQ
jgi:hypothetical protein